MWFAAACLSVTINCHSLLLLPMAIVNNGGISFLSIYTILMIIIGAPLLLTEMFLGQFSGLSSVQLHHNLCPLMTGLGVAQVSSYWSKLLNTVFSLAQYLVTIIKSVLNISLMVWLGRALYDVFTLLDADQGMDTVKELATLQQETPTAEKLFSLEMSELISLAVVIVLLLLLTVGGIMVTEKLYQFLLAASSLLLVTLVTRCCLTDKGSTAVR